MVGGKDDLSAGTFFLKEVLNVLALGTDWEVGIFLPDFNAVVTADNRLIGANAESLRPVPVCLP